MNVICLFLILLLVILSPGCAEQEAGDASSEIFLDKSRHDLLQAESALKGKELYQHYCLLCHGEEGKGNGYNAFTLEVPPANLADRDAMQKLSDEQLFSLVTEGSVSMGMSPLCPPWGRVLKKGDVLDLIVYVRSLSQKSPSADP